MPRVADPGMPPSLREYLEQRLDYERTLVAEKFLSVNRALELQAKEYERRLQELNHAHAIAKEKEKDTLPREIFYAFRDEYEKRHRVLELALTAIQSRGTTWIVAIGIFLSALTVALRFIV